MRRKHLGCHFFACEWTGVPLKNNKFYLPFFRNGKWIKFGNYMNWQCAAAHAYYLSRTKQIDNLDETLKQLNEVAGYEVHAAPDFSELSHFGGTLSVCQFKKKAVHRSDTLTAILITKSSEAKVVQLNAVDGTHTNSIQDALESSRFDEIELMKKSKLGKDVHVLLLTNLQSGADTNTAVHSTVKGIGVNIAGSVIVTCCKGPRSSKSYSNLTMEDFVLLTGGPLKTMADIPNKHVGPVKPPKQQVSVPTLADVAAMSKTEFNKIAAEMKRGMQQIDTTLEDAAAVPPKKRAKRAAVK